MTPPDQLFLALQATLAGRYSLERELGRGGMGIVFLARDVQLDRPVALKLLPPEIASVPERRVSFLREARMAARLAHPNIVPIHAVEEVGDFVFYAMRYVAGESLGERLRRTGRLAPSATGAILRDVAYALAYAHAQGVIHRDIKPDNILLEGEGTRALVTDFGIAVLQEDVAAQNRLVGTPEYVAPEQAAGSAVDGRSDLYSLGAMGYHMLAGRPPFVGDAAQMLAQHLTQRPTPLLEVVPELRPALAAAIDRALSKDPDDRFSTAEAMADALEPPRALTQELPVPVRIWVERGRELKGLYLIWSLFFYGIGTMAFVVSGIEFGLRSLSAQIFIALCGLATALPWIGHGKWRVLETRRALEAGVTLEELRNGLDVALVRREEELRYEMARPVHWIPKAVRGLTYLGFSAAMAGLLYGVAVAGPRAPVVSFGLFALGTMLTVGGALFGLIFPGRRVRPVDPFARLRKWMWNGPFGEVMTKVAGVGLRTSGVPTWATWRPTEVALGHATEALFSALPDSVRQNFADLPKVVQRLEREAEHARQQIAAGASGAWPARLQHSVAAIDTLRVGLLRMTAGRMEAGSLTADLEAARDLAERIDYLVAGSDEVASLLDRDSGNSVQSSTQAVPKKSAPITSLG